MFNEYTDSLKEAIDSCDAKQWNIAINIISEAYKNGRNIFTCGNGGSASTASHYIVDWNKMTLHYNHKALKGICLCDNIGTLTAYANDYDYSKIFSEQLKFYANKSDVLIIVSGSGNSDNILNALRQAKELQLTTIAVVGFDGGRASKLADYCVHVPKNDMQIVEDLHLSFGHMVMKHLCEFGVK